jgi:predicted RNase H-like HicB family nuclease
MKLTAVFEPAKEGGYTCFVEEIPAAISQGEIIEEAKANLADALKLALQCQRELAEKGLSPLV